VFADSCSGYSVLLVAEDVVVGDFGGALYEVCSASQCSF
jgi:hypothetical protein